MGFRSITRASRVLLACALLLAATGTALSLVRDLPEERAVRRAEPAGAVLLHTARVLKATPAVVTPTTTPMTTTTTTTAERSIASSPAPPAPPAPAVVVEAAPPVRPPAPAGPTQPLETRLRAAYDAVIPAAWQAAITVTLEPIAGTTSWGWPSGRIEIAESHARSDATMRVTIAHEFGHLIAFRYGSQAYNGAAPSGWPAYSSQPAEAWADCVAAAFTGDRTPSHGLPACSGASLAWTVDWLASGPR